MARKAAVRSYSPATLNVIELLGKRIAVARKRRKETAAQLAERVGIVRNTLAKIEAGNPSCEIGVVLELARLSGVPFFSDDPTVINRELARADAELSLLPKAALKSIPSIDDDF